MVLKNGRVTGKALLALLVLILLCGASYGTYVWQQRSIDKINNQNSLLNSRLDDATKNLASIPTHSYISKGGFKIYVYLPEANSKVASPLIVVGQVPGNWSFEASFPVQLKDNKGNVLAKTPAQLLGDWMTDQLVPFSVKLNFTATAGQTGTLLLQKDNPSGLEKNDDSLSIPVRF